MSSREIYRFATGQWLQGGGGSGGRGGRGEGGGGGGKGRQMKSSRGAGVKMGPGFWVFEVHEGVI